MIVALGLVLAAVFLFPRLLDRVRSSMIVTPSTKPEELVSPEEFEAAEIDRLLEDEDFVQVFNNFYYPDSEIVEASLVDESQNLFFVRFESVDDYDKVEDYYNNKNVQSIWQKSDIYEKDEESRTSRFTFYGLEENKIVNLLISDKGQQTVSITVIYWELQ